MREATPPEVEAELYNYNFKDKWDLSLAQAGMSSSLEPPSEDNFKGNKKKSGRKAPESRISYSSQDDSAWGGLDSGHCLCSIFDLRRLQEVSTTEWTRTTDTGQPTRGGETAERRLALLTRTTRPGLLSYRELETDCWTTNDK